MFSTSWYMDFRKQFLWQRDQLQPYLLECKQIGVDTTCLRGHLGSLVFCRVLVSRVQAGVTSLSRSDFMWPDWKRLCGSPSIVDMLSTTGWWCPCVVVVWSGPLPFKFTAVCCVCLKSKVLSFIRNALFLTRCLLWGHNRSPFFFCDA